MLSQHRSLLFGILLFAVPFATAPVNGASGARGQSPDAQAPPAPAQKTQKSRARHSNDFLVHGTVFTPEGLSFPGAEIRIRRVSEKKFHWKTYTNSRGEFAVRVKQGSEYEVVSAAKGFIDEKKEVDAKTGVTTGDLSFRMERKGEKKP